MGLTMALVKAHRDREARDGPNAALSSNPATSLSRMRLRGLLAASPDASVRDGKRAMTLVQQMLQRGRTLDPERPMR